MIAAMAMQGIIASLTADDADMDLRGVAISAIRNADAPLAELDKTK